MEKEQITSSPKERKTSVLGVLGSVFILCVGIFVLFWSVFGLWSYLYPTHETLFSKPILVNQPEKVFLTGADGVYFANLPTQQIQLTESLNPLRTLEIQVAIMLKKASDYQIVAAHLPILQDTLISDLKNTTLAELSQNERLFIIKETLFDHFSTLLSPVEIQDVLLQKIVVKENE